MADPALDGLAALFSITPQAIAPLAPGTPVTLAILEPTTFPENTLAITSTTVKVDILRGSGKFPVTAVARSRRVSSCDGAKFEFEKELEYVTRENVTSDAVQARLRGELGANLPLPTEIPALPLSPSSAA